MPRLLVLLLAVLAFTTACSGDDDKATDTAPLDLTGDWVLTEGIASNAQMELDATHPITLTVEGDQASGQSACNRYMGQVTVSGDSVEFGTVGGTQMACVPDTVMALETAYLSALGTVDTGALDGDTLTLTGTGTSLTFTRAAPVGAAELAGTNWRLESLIEGDAVSSTTGKPAKLLLSDDGTITGSTGCRQFRGTWDVSGDQKLGVYDLAQTKQACPDDVNAQDQLVLAVITGSPQIQMDGMSLTLTLDDGRGLSYLAR